MASDKNILELSSHSLCQGLSAGLFISAGKGMHPTRVTDFHEIIMVRSGVLGIYEGDTEFEVLPGQTLHLFPGRKHGPTLDYTKELSFYWLHFQVPKNCKPTADATALRIPQHCSIGQPERIYELLHRYLADIETQHDDELSRSLLVMMILREISVASPQPAADTAGQHLAHRAMEYIATNFHRPISTVDVAEKLGCNLDYIGRVFKQTFRISPVAAINARRIAKAKQMLVSSPDNIDQIAATCGFSSAAYMRKVFAKQTGTTPSQYRKQFSRVHFNTE